MLLRVALVRNVTNSTWYHRSLLDLVQSLQPERFAASSARGRREIAGRNRTVPPAYRVSARL